MSHAHTDAAWTVRGLPQIAHHLLLCLADSACRSCGLTWTGVATMSERTGIGPTAVREALKLMVKSGHLRVHAYPKGGRARTTEYVVLPELMELFTAPCGRCQALKQKAPAGDGFQVPGRHNPSRGGGYTKKPTARRAQYPPPGETTAKPANPQESMELDAKNAAKNGEYPVSNPLSSKEVISETADAANHSEPPNPVPKPDTSAPGDVIAMLDALRSKFGPSDRS